MSSSDEEEAIDAIPLKNSENAEKINFDFEALPPEAEDVDQICNLLTQVMLFDQKLYCVQHEIF